MSNSGGGKYAVFITVIGIMTFDYALRIRGTQLPLVATAGLFPVWMIFYVMGVLKAQNLEMPYMTKSPLRGAIIAIVLCCIQMVVFHRINGYWIHGIKLSAHIYSFFIIMWLFTDHARSIYNKIGYMKISSHVVLIGKYSFFIYLTHYLILYTYNYFELPIMWSFRFMLCVILSYVLAVGFHNITPPKIKKYIGF